MMPSAVAAALVVLGGASALPAEEITYTKHIAPILWKHCADCHRPGEVAPFPLLTYKDAARRARHLKEITASRRMPPWKPEPGVGDFQDVRRLSDRDLALLARWADSGAKEGDPRDLPPAPKFKDGWRLGPPDLVLKMSEPFAIPAGGADVWRCFVIPTNLTEDKAVAAVEFRPGNRRVVHHATFFLDTTGKARKLDEAEPGPGYRGEGGPRFPPTGALGGWVPGSTPRFLPDGLGRKLRQGSDLIMAIHYHPSGKPETDQSSLAVYFARKPVTSFIRPLQLSARPIRIPAGAKRHRVTDTFTLPVDVHVYAAAPHMHLLGREIKVTATLPGGQVKPLISIKDWDFNWQGPYYYREPLALPAGTRLELEGYYDNSSDNPQNPNNPPKFVHGGNRTTDEMCQCMLQLVLDRQSDRRAFGRAVMLHARPGKAPLAKKKGLWRRIPAKFGPAKAAPAVTAPKGAGATRTIKDFRLSDVKGGLHTPAEWRDRKAVVLFFLGTECPVSNGYAPLIEELSHRYAARGVAFYGVHSDPDVTAKVATEHAATYRLTLPLLLDPAQVLASQAKVDTVPQAVVLAPDGRVLYRGRIDDRYSLDGKRRDEPRTRDLIDAVDAVLAGRSPAAAETAAFGCPLPTPRK